MVAVLPTAEGAVAVRTLFPVVIVDATALVVMMHNDNEYAISDTVTTSTRMRHCSSKSYGMKSAIYQGTDRHITSSSTESNERIPFAKEGRAVINRCVNGNPNNRLLLDTFCEQLDPCALSSNLLRRAHASL
eukprot:3285912-Pleurochrysis_carterae.AAC.1